MADPPKTPPGTPRTTQYIFRRRKTPHDDHIPPARKPGSKAKTKANPGSSPKGRGGKPADGKTSRQRVEDAVADRIIELLDQGQLPPWEKDWRDSVNGLPRNAVSMKPYRGVNRWMTLLTHMVMGYQDPRWLTYRQAEALGGHVRKGERSTEIVFWKRVPVRDRRTGRRDAVQKRSRYAALGIPEYWRFDETGEFHGTMLAGDRLMDGRYEPIPI